MRRKDGREEAKLRKVKFEKDYLKYPQGSCFIQTGNTKIICSATFEDSVPPFLRNSGTGWVTARYGMLPGSCPDRVSRNQQTGRIFEIQRLIGRSLRAVVDMDKIGEGTLWVDCDVLQADGGTRTASITGGFVAMWLAFETMKKEAIIKENPIREFVAAVSVGIVDENMLLDLTYHEDSQAQVDMNIVLTESNKIIEIQGSAETIPFDKKQLDEMLNVAQRGIQEIIVFQKELLQS